MSTIVHLVIYPSSSIDTKLKEQESFFLGTKYWGFALNFQIEHTVVWITCITLLKIALVIECEVLLDEYNKLYGGILHNGEEFCSGSASAPNFCRCCCTVPRRSWFFFFLRIGQFASNRNYNLPGIVNVACERNSIQPGKRKSRRGHCPAPMRKSQGLKELQPWQSLHLPLSPPLSPAPPSSWLYSQGSLAVLEGKMAPGVVGLHTSSRSWSWEGDIFSPLKGLEKISGQMLIRHSWVTALLRRNNYRKWK